jgi:hypothetical protein
MTKALQSITLLYFVLLLQTAMAQDTTALKGFLIGRWEVIKYSEQGVQVDKKQAAMPQAQRVYSHVSVQRSLIFYGYDEESGNRRTRAFERWEEQDSLREVNRIAEAIATPYFAVFFADSTLSVYNKEVTTNVILFPESRQFTFHPATMSIDISIPGGYGVQWQAQVLVLTRDRLVLFLPEEAEVVELIKTEFILP